MLRLIQKSIRIGNSWGVIIPSSVWKAIGATPGDELILYVNENKELIIYKEGVAKPSVHPEFIEILERMNKKYGKALAELAKK